MTKDHVFFDSLGNKVKGREKMEKGWKDYFSLFPNNKIPITEIFQKGSALALFGLAQGTYHRNGEHPIKTKWKIPTAWKAVAKQGRVSEWRVLQTITTPSGF